MPTGEGNPEAVALWRPCVYQYVQAAIARLLESSLAAYLGFWQIEAAHFGDSA